MFSSSVLNNTAAGSSNPIHRHYPHNQHLQDSARDHVPIDSTITIISPSSGRTSTGSAAAGVAKKRSDNRSKIKTAQGLRDRRVRLSIGIARKFFDLQDLLEFDKPSKTVEWLLTKSNRAILELSAASSSEETATRDCCKSLSSSRSSNQAEQVSCDASFKTGKQKAALLARENARARARARTVAKLCAAKVDVNYQKFKLLNNPEVKNGGETSHFSANWYSSSSPSFLKSLASEEERNGVEQLEPPTYGLNPNLSLDWNISTQQSSSAAHILNLSRGIKGYVNSQIWRCIVDRPGISYSTITELCNIFKMEGDILVGSLQWRLARLHLSSLSMSMSC